MLNDFWEYDTTFNAWTQLADFGGVARRDAVGFSIGSKGYIGTGIDNYDSNFGNQLSDFWEYDPASNVWTQRANFPGNFGGGVYKATGFEAGGMGYICGGQVGSSSYSNELWQYNPSTNMWLQRANFPPGDRFGLTSFSINGKGYVGTGADYNLMNNDLWEYNPSGDTWAQKNNLPASQRMYCTGFAIGTKGYIALGTDGGSRTDLFEYNPSTNSWAVRSAYPGAARKSTPAFTIGNEAFVGTGSSDAGDRKDMYVYSPLVPAAVEEISQENLVSVFPNPFAETATLRITNLHALRIEKIQITFFNLAGEEVQPFVIRNSDSFVIRRNNLRAGIYLYKVSDEKKIIGTGKIIVE